MFLKGFVIPMIHHLHLHKLCCRFFIIRPTKRLISAGRTNRSSLVSMLIRMLVLVLFKDAPVWVFMDLVFIHSDWRTFERLQYNCLWCCSYGIVGKESFCFWVRWCCPTELVADKSFLFLFKAYFTNHMIHIFGCSFFKIFTKLH